MMNDDDNSSGFFDTEIEQPEPSVAFGHIEEFYVSPNGYTRLFRANRYGKNLILKTLKPENREMPFYQQALQKEFAIGYQLTHPHICSTIGLEDVPGIGTCIVQEYIDGITLAQYMQQGKLNKRTARKIITELCDALKYLHSKQIIHRDLKPDNIMITHNGDNVKLIDFSLADSDDSTVLKIPAGTRRYTAPEAQEKGYTPTLLADIYSLGIIIGEMGETLKNKRLLQVASKCTSRLPECRLNSTTAVMQALTHTSILRILMVAAFFACCLIAAGAYFYLRQPSVTGPDIYPTYGNIPENNACRELIRQKVAEQNGASLTEVDSLKLMQGVEALLQETFPTASMQATPVYRNQIAYWSREVSKLMKISVD